MNVYYLDTVTAVLINDLKNAIRTASAKNTDGKYDRMIQKDKALIRSFMDDIVRPQAA